MKIDLHIHSKERSKCGKSLAEQQIQAAINAGIDSIAFTDHKHLTPPNQIVYLNTKYAPFRIIQGIEISVDDEDVIVLGIYDTSLETKKRNYQQLQQFVREHQGFLVLVHPFRHHSIITIPIQKFPPHAIEIYSRNTPLNADKQILNIAHSLNIPVLSNSDAHTSNHIGRHYNLLTSSPHSDKEIFHILKFGAFTAIFE